MSSGTGQLVDGRAVVYASDVEFVSEIEITRTDPEGILGELGVALIMPGIAFVVVSSSLLDESGFSWQVGIAG